MNGYKSITGDDEILIVGGDDAEKGSIIYFIDSVSGRIADSVIEERIYPFHSISYDGKYIYAFNRTIGISQIIFPNTVMMDFYKLRYEIDKMGYVMMKDDMGVVKRVAVTGLSKERKNTNEKSFTVSLSVEKIDVSG
ncbi:hypothetical protein D3C72_1059380 [compost metagenome]